MLPVLEFDLNLSRVRLSSERKGVSGVWRYCCPLRLQHSMRRASSKKSLKLTNQHPRKVRFCPASSLPTTQLHVYFWAFFSLQRCFEYSLPLSHQSHLPWGGEGACSLHLPRPHLFLLKESQSCHPGKHGTATSSSVDGPRGLGLCLDEEPNHMPQG